MEFSPISYILVSALMLMLTHWAFDLKNLMNPFVVFYIYHTVFFFIALSYAEQYQSADIFISNLTKNLIVFGYITSLSGALFAKYFFQGIGVTYILPQKLQIEYPSQVFYYSSFIILFLGYLFALIFYYKAGAIPALREDVETFRIEARKGSGMITILSILFTSYATLVITLYKRNKWWINLPVLITTSFVLVSFGNRAPLLKFLLVYLICYLIISKSKINFKKLIIFGLFLFSFNVLLGAMRKGGDVALSEMFLATFGWRPFATIFVFDKVLADFHPFLYGEGYLIDLKTLLPGYSPNFGTWMKEWLGMTFAGGSVTMSYLGDAYANFGLIGVFIYPFIHGFFFCSIYMAACMRKRMNLIVFILMFLIAQSMGGAANTGIMPVFLFLIPLSVPVVFHLFTALSIRKLFVAQKKEAEAIILN